MIIIISFLVLSVKVKIHVIRRVQLSCRTKHVLILSQSQLNNLQEVTLLFFP